MQLLRAPEATFKNIVDGVLIIRFALIGPLVYYIWLELVELFNTQIKILLEGKESISPTSDIIRYMEDWMGVGSSRSIRGTGGRVSARHCE